MPPHQNCQSKKKKKKPVAKGQVVLMRGYITNIFIENMHYTEIISKLPEIRSCYELFFKDYEDQ